MHQSGQPPGTRGWAGLARGAVVAPLVFAAAAAILVVDLWGFTVDDALIPARYAAHIAAGKGYVFNAGRASTDGVTPLGFPYLLAPFASGGVLRALAFARMSGALAWILGAALVGRLVAAVPGPRVKFLAGAIVLVSAPLGAWAGAGLETGLVTSLVALGLFLKYEVAAGEVLPAAVLGVVGAMRPECLPMVLLVAFGRTGREPADDKPLTGAHFTRLFTALAPFVAVAVARLAQFGRPAPLSVYAKPPIAEFGLAYAGACFLLTGPIALLAPLAWKRVPKQAHAILGGAFVHFLSIALAGGDWMPVSRLVVPAMPVIVLGAAHVLAVSHRIIGPVRLGIALAGEVFTLVKMRASLRRVMDDRRALMEEAAPFLEGRKAIGALDIGWVGAVTESTIVDFAGVTDPFVASLPGTHTSKPVPDALLDTVGVDTLVLLVKDGAEIPEDWTTTAFDRGVERFVALGPGVGDRFEIAHVTTGRLRYVIAYRKTARAAAH